MTTRPRASAVIAVKDGAEFIATTLTSLAQQFEDASDLEVIIIDDGSTDATAEIAESFLPLLPRLSVESNPTAQGVGSARVRGLELATGEYVAFVDADDWMSRGRLPSLIQSIERLDVDFVRTDHVKAEGAVRTIVRAPEGRRNVALDPRSAILPAETGTMIDYPYPWAGMCHRRVIDNGIFAYDAGLQTAEDRPAVWRLHLNAASFAVVSAPEIFYRRGVTTSLTQIYDRRQLDFLAAFGVMRDLVAADSEPDRFMPKVVRQFLAIASHHVMRVEGMDSATKADLGQGIRDFATSLPQDVLTEQWAGSSTTRKRLLGSFIDRDIRMGVAR